MTTYLGTTVPTGYLPGPHALYALRLERPLISYQDAKYPWGFSGVVPSCVIPSPVWESTGRRESRVTCFLPLSAS